MNMNTNEYRVRTWTDTFRKLTEIDAENLKVPQKTAAFSEQIELTLVLLQDHLQL